MRLLLILFLSLVSLNAMAQYTSRLGRFRVDQVKGCAPFTITITDTNLVTSGECTAGKPCLMDFEGNGTRSQNSFTFTYNNPGTYKLSVLYQSIGADDINITVVANKEPTYELYTCAGTQVSLKVTDKTYDTYVIDFNNDGTPETIIPSGNNATATHNYGAAGTYNVAVRGKNVNSADNCKNKVESFQTLAVLPTPAITTLTALDANRLKLNMTTAPHIQYKLEIALNNSNNFQVLKNLYQVSADTVTNLVVDANYYCFRVSAFDPCLGTNKYSNTICSQDFDVSFLNGANVLTWRTATAGISSVSIKRNGSAYTNIPGAPLDYRDQDYDCNKDYCYEITSNYPGGAKSISLTKCGVGILQTIFPAIENVGSKVGANGVDLEWEADPTIDVKEFEVWRSVLQDAFVRFGTVPTGNYSDPSYATDGKICYQINYSDFCDNRSADGIIVCPIRLTGTMDEKNAITLNWTRYKGWKNGVNTYQLTKFNKNNGVVATITTTDTTYFDFDVDDPDQIVSYQVVAISNDGGLTNSVSNRLTFEKAVRLIFPTAFTPNGDAVNPMFTISGRYVAKMSIKIFDRWGLLVYASDTNEPWDGTKGGKPMPESAYVWKADVVDFAGHSFSREGTIILIRPPK